MSQTVINRYIPLQTHGYSNRLIRLIRSRHVRDLLIIGTSAVILASIVLLIWLFLFVYNDSLTKRLDAPLARFYAVSACLREQDWLDDKKVQQISQVESGLSNSRRQLPLVNNYLWSYISQSPGPLSELQSATKTISDDLVEIRALPGSASPSPGVAQGPNFTCSATAAPTDSQKARITSHVQILLTTATHLTSALATVGATQGLVSFLTVIAALGTAVLGFGGWLYRTADARLTVIDLIASEIFSLCRAAANNRSVEKLIKSYETDDVGLFGFLEITERYDDIMKSVGMNFGFFDQYTVTRVIGYNTSLKIFLDRVRMLKAWAADIKKTSSELTDITFDQLSEENVKILRGLLEQIINDLFICFENARISLHCLLERGALHDQSIFVCLLSEMRAFTFLRARTSNVEYARRRFADRLRPQAQPSERLAGSHKQMEDTYDEFESYSYPAFSTAIWKLLKNYDSYYGKGLGGDVADILSGYASSIDIEIGGAVSETKVAAV